MRIQIVGHLPPPVTGENLCRAQFVDALGLLGVGFRNVSRGGAVGSFRGCDQLVVYNGESRAGTVFDVMLTFVSILAGRRVFWYFHNNSWRRFVRLRAALWMGMSSRITVLVLRRDVADAFERAGYQAQVLANCPELQFEAVAREAVVPRKRIVWMGRLEREKGFHTAVSVFERLHHRDPEWIFDVYGGSYEDAEKMGFTREGIVYHGFISGEHKVKAFDQGGVFILPSQYKNENQPLSIIEAFSRGIPVVASSVGGIREMLSDDDGSAGVCVLSGDVDDYVEACLEVQEHYLLYSESALRKYRSCFSRIRFSREVKALILSESKFCGGQQDHIETC